MQPGAVALLRVVPDAARKTKIEREKPLAAAATIKRQAKAVFLAPALYDAMPHTRRWGRGRQGTAKRWQAV